MAISGRCRGGTGRRRERAGDAGMRPRTRARSERGSEQERSSLRRGSAPFYGARAAKNATLHDNVVFCSLYHFFLSLLYYWFVEHRLRERANRMISGSNGAGESERSDGPNERSVRSDGWMDRMERVAPPLRCVLSSSSCRRAGGGVTMRNLCLRQTLRVPTNIFPFFCRFFSILV